jgi:hypothetical protein
MRTKTNLFRALIDSYEHLNGHGFSASGIPTLVFLDPKDELISPEKLDRSLARYHLMDWTRIDVTNAGHEGPETAHHYLISPLALGQQEWGGMMDQAIDFLDKNQ